MRRTLLTIAIIMICIAIKGQNTTTIIFTGEDQHGQWVQLHNVVVENITKQWQIPLYYPDTILILKNQVGINDEEANVSQNGALAVSVSPNPFNGSTEAELTVIEEGTAQMKINDINGRNVASLATPHLVRGKHFFKITLATPQTYILNISINGNSVSTKLINAYSGGTNRIEMTGSAEAIGQKKPFLFASNPFSQGDLMKYFGYVIRNGSTFTDIISQNQNGNGTITFHFILPDSIIPPSTLCNDTIITQSATFCSGTSYIWRGKTLTAAGAYFDSLKTSAGGCDSIYFLSLSSLPTTFSTQSASICQGATYPWHGKSLSAAGLYSDTITGANGCDSICYLTLSILPNSLSSQSVTICPNSTYYWHGKTISAAGVYSDTIQSSNGCDSICQLLVSIGTTYFFQLKDSIPAGSTLVWHGQTLNAAGIYHDYLKTADGCDSIYQLDLSIIQPAPVPFTCGVSLATDIDGNTYHTLQIGTQCWMKENLKTTRFPNGNTIPTSSSSSTVLPYLYYPNNDIQNVAAYGYLYNWTAAVNSSSAGDYPVQGACPDGWHIPNINEWKTLINTIKANGSWLCNSNSSYIAKAAASQVGWATATQTCAVGNGLSQNNASGFTAMPAGITSGQYTYYFGTDCKIWSSEEGTSDNSEGSSFYLQNTSTNLYTTNGIWSKGYSFSVRCLYGAGGQIKVTTSQISSVGSTTAVCGGAVNIDGNTPITARGVCWSTSPNPTISNPHTTDGSGLGSFTSTITGLTPLIPYYVRAYATNSFGTAYGEEVAVVIPNANDGATCTGTPTVTDKDGNTYNTVQIGKQCWMKENLRTKSYSDGRSITYGASNTSTSTAYYYYPYGSNSNITTYGLLYNVAAVFDGAGSSTANPSGIKGICPNGWHLPSRAEWTQLTDYVGANLNFQCNSSYKNYAKSMCSTSGWNNGYSACTPGNSPATNNATGFSVQPAGYFDGSAYASSGQHSRIWTTYKNSSNAYYIQFSYYGPASYQLSSKFYEANSVRCVKD
ncbi:MAG: hypothetical protein J6W84_05215 [Bacteroidales bacterium]|nr:hypothetical protein [Bacteroidales bacterium]